MVQDSYNGKPIVSRIHYDLSFLVTLNDRLTHISRSRQYSTYLSYLS